MFCESRGYSSNQGVSDQITLSPLIPDSALFTQQRNNPIYNLSVLYIRQLRHRAPEKSVNGRYTSKYQFRY